MARLGHIGNDQEQDTKAKTMASYQYHVLGNDRAKDLGTKANIIAALAFASMTHTTFPNSFSFQTAEYSPNQKPSQQNIFMLSNSVN